MIFFSYGYLPFIYWNILIFYIFIFLYKRDKINASFILLFML